MLQLRAVHKNRPGLTLRDIDLSLEPGAVLLVSGATGAGKSTLLELVYGGSLADAGTVEVFGRDVARLRRSSVALMRRHMGIVPQTLELLDTRTVSDNVALPLTVCALGRKEIRARVAETLACLELTELGARRVCNLSLGQRQLVAVARALAAQPDLLIADEPTAYLDNPARDLVLSAMSRLCERGSAALIATNDHKVLSAGARLGWSHAEIAGHTVQPVAERDPSVVIAIGSEDRGVTPLHRDPDTYYEEYSCRSGESLPGDDNVVPLPLRVAYAGGLAK